jgi:hypothetical protein
MGTSWGNGDTNQPTSGQVTLSEIDGASGAVLYSLELSFVGCVDSYTCDFPPICGTSTPNTSASCPGCAEVTVDGQPALPQCGGWGL